MDRGFADAELRGGGPDRCLVLDDVLGQRGGPLLDIALQIRNTPRLSLLQPMRGSGGICRRGQGTFRGNGCPPCRDMAFSGRRQSLGSSGALPKNMHNSQFGKINMVDTRKKVSIFLNQKRKHARTGPHGGTWKWSRGNSGRRRYGAFPEARPQYTHKKER